MHRLRVALLGASILGAIAARASAQPAAAPDPSAPDPSTPAALEPAPVAFDPLDDAGWPYGLTLEDLRTLPECGPNGLPHTPGALATCRPAVLPGPVQWSLGVDWITGGTFGEVPTTGGANGLGAQLDFALSRSWLLGARYELLGVGLPTAPGDAEVSGLSNQFFADVKRRLWTDETGRNAWTLGAGAGYALRGDRLGGDAPIVRASLTREVGMYIDDANALDAQLELSYEQSFGDQQLEAVLAGIRLGFETQIREPENLGSPAPPTFSHTSSFFVIAGPWLGLGVGLGLRASPAWSLETDADFVFGYSRDDDQEHGLDGASWTLETGPRWQAPFPSERFPLYVQLQGGATWYSRDPEGELRPTATGELGFRGLLGCGGGVDLGAWVRADVGDGIDVVAGGAVLRMTLGSDSSAAGGTERGRCDGRGQPLLAVPYVPPPEPVAVTPVAPPPPDANVNVNVDVHANANVNVDVHATIEPVVVEVELGAAFYGVQVRVDPRLLPFDRLRGAGWIDVELSGPDNALGQFQGELSAALGRGGIRVDGWAALSSGSSVVRAKFTIWPPGTRPPGR